jgi:sugar O-acyltransferase (sialic acid O-acetyltransferase NeuD family)
MSRIVIVGAGGQGAIVADILRDAVGFVDDDPKRAGTTVLDLPVLGPIAALPQIEHDAVVVAIGDNRHRRAITERLCAGGERLATVIHPSASVAPSATIGAGSMLSAGALLLPRAAIGRGVILNTKASVDHDSVVADFAHVSVGATLGANVHVGAETLVALGASVISGITVGARTVVGAGAVVVRDLPDDVTALGVPARITSDRRATGSMR